MILKSSIGARMLAAMLICICGTAIIAALIIEQRIIAEEHDHAHQKLSKAASMVAADFSSLLNDAFLAELRSYTNEVAEAYNVRVTVFDSLMNPVSDSFPRINNTDNLKDRPEFQFGDDQDTMVLPRYSTAEEENVLWLSTRLWDNDALVGTLRLGASLERLDYKLPAIRWSLLFAAAVASLIMLVPTLYFARRLRRPMLTMAKQLSKPSHLPSQLDELTMRDDEVGLLSRAIVNNRTRCEQDLSRLHTERSVYHRALISMEDGLVAIDSDEFILFINSNAARYFDTSIEACKDRRLWEIVRKHPIASEMHYLLDVSSSAPREARFFNKEGEERWVRILASPLITDQEEKVGYLFLLRDITQMTKLMKSREDLISNVSHEFKTPLTAIRGIAETMLTDEGMSASTRYRFLERILQQSDRLKTIARNLLDLVRIETGANTEPLEDIDIRQIVESTFETLAERAEVKELEYELIQYRHPLVVMIRHNAMMQIIENLLDNAIKYTPQKGRVSVRMSAQAGWAIVEVSDTGIGISEQDLDRVFERFYRTSAARQPETEGTGLGLAIAKSLVDYYEGEITVSSYEGKGSIFCVSLPLKPQK